MKSLPSSFGGVQVQRQGDGSLFVVARLTQGCALPDAVTGLALDASRSMIGNYGDRLWGERNLVEGLARQLGKSLCEFAADGCTNLIYWACGPDGSQIESIGSRDRMTVDRTPFDGPKQHSWGSGCKLLPALRFFFEGPVRDAGNAIIVFLTDGVIEDETEVVQFSLKLGQQVAAGNRGTVKLVLLGLGNEVDERQMERLDDMFFDAEIRSPDGSSIDLWSHGLAAEMSNDRQVLDTIFAELITDNFTVAQSGRILDSQNSLIQEYPSGVPGTLRFTLPPNETRFLLELDGQRYVHDLSADEAVGHKPASELTTD